ncbi:uronyl 2-sulfotransferase-like [Saccoglossus kowalevskii]|uniref:Uronyl 2-sulfotransferase-like n=1 Tax=Saccoglossus kowalevskii TaxID=10224 RepID=A0ABM0LTZ0_SACKO|nr:PREDICTED: uronyl 2-sulfotransferase-like [Saccoglossus kowalevskii]
MSYVRVLQQKPIHRLSLGASLFLTACLTFYVFVVYRDYSVPLNTDTGVVVLDSRLLYPDYGIWNWSQSSTASFNTTATDLVFYNKVGKCGSRSLVYLLRRLGRINNFTSAGQSKTPNSKSRYLTPTDQLELVQRITSLPRPATFYRHTVFIDFLRFGAQRPIYINIIRRPLDRLVSEYYFKRFGDDKNSSKGFLGETKYQSFDDCVLLNKSECRGDNIFYIIPYFCGQQQQCRSATEWALQTAKVNVINHFLVVGLSEEYENTLRVLEKMLPQFFTTAVRAFKTPGVIPSTKTRKKQPPKPEVVKIMTERLKLEIEFYEFIKDRFQRLKRQLQIDVHDNYL